MVWRKGHNPAARAAAKLRARAARWRGPQGCGARHWRSVGPCRRPRGHGGFHRSSTLVWDNASSWWRLKYRKHLEHRVALRHWSPPEPTRVDRGE